MNRRDDILNAIRAVLSAETDDFAELAEIAGLDPRKHFISANLRGVDFGGADLNRFDLQGAVTDGAIFGEATPSPQWKTELTRTETKAPITDIFRAIGQGDTSQEPNIGGAASSAHLVGRLENLLYAEAEFFTRLRERAAEKCKRQTDIDGIQRALGNPRVVNIARFFFLLQAYACDTPEAVQKLLISHNARISSLEADRRFGERSRREYSKARFNAARIATCVQTFEQMQRAVFTKAEISSLLFEHMGRAAAYETLDLLVSAGLLFEQYSDPLIGSNRILLFTDGYLEKAVFDYLSELGGIGMAPEF